MTNNFILEKDIATKKIHVVREFNAPIEKVWKAWTDPDLLGAVSPGASAGHWDNKFSALDNKTIVVVDLSFDDEATMKMMVEMGFEVGFTMGLNQLDELLAL